MKLHAVIFAILCLGLVAFFAVAGSSHAAPIGNAFTYQGVADALRDLRQQLRAVRPNGRRGARPGAAVPAEG